MVCSYYVHPFQLEQSTEDTDTAGDTAGDREGIMPPLSRKIRGSRMDGGSRTKNNSNTASHSQGVQVVPPSRPSLLLAWLGSINTTE